MDEQAKDVIAKDMIDDIKDGETFRKALKNTLQKNEKFQKSISWNSPSKKQKSALRDRITADKRTEALSINKKDNVDYINVGKGNYRKVLSSKDYYYDSDTDKVYIRDSDGQWSKTVI